MTTAGCQGPDGDDVPSLREALAIAEQFDGRPLATPIVGNVGFIGFIAAFGFGQAVVFGTSGGAEIALELLARHALVVKAADPFVKANSSEIVRELCDACEPSYASAFAVTGLLHTCFRRTARAATSNGVIVRCALRNSTPRADCPTTAAPCAKAIWRPGDKTHPEWRRTVSAPASARPASDGHN